MDFVPLAQRKQYDRKRRWARSERRKIRDFFVASFDELRKSGKWFGNIDAAWTGDELNLMIDMALPVAMNYIKFHFIPKPENFSMGVSPEKMKPEDLL
jgi:hypothetical protein